VLRVTGGFDSSTPPLSLDHSMPKSSGIPVLTVTENDATVLAEAAAAGDLVVHLSGNAEQLLGADPEGRLYLNASDNPSRATLSHWEGLARVRLGYGPLDPAPRWRAPAAGRLCRAARVRKRLSHFPQQLWRAPRRLGRFDPSLLRTPDERFRRARAGESMARDVGRPTARARKSGAAD
jgi:hypothetical protein